MTLYLNHFGLREAPFKITPTVEFFYQGGKRGDILHALLYAVKVGEGIMMVTGEVGSGKTMMLRTMAERLPGEADLIYIANPSLSGREILFHICEELDLPVGGDRHDTARRLQNYLVERHAEGRRVVAFIDEAQAMPDESLEEIRLLSNLETSREKLLQIILFGQPELDDKLSRQNMRQLRERITVSFKLEPLSRADVREYVATRLRAAGYEGGPLFSDEACNLVYAVSQGLSRRVNVLADKALLSAYERGARAVAVGDVKRAADDVKFTRMRYRSARAKTVVRRAAYGLAAAAALVLAVAIGARGPQNQDPAPDPAAPTLPGDNATGDNNGAEIVYAPNPETNSDSYHELDAAAGGNSSHEVAATDEDDSYHESDSSSASASTSSSASAFTPESVAAADGMEVDDAAKVDGNGGYEPGGYGPEAGESLAADEAATDGSGADEIPGGGFESVAPPIAMTEAESAEVVAAAGETVATAAEVVASTPAPSPTPAPAPAPAQIVATVVERVIERITVVQERVTVERVAVVAEGRAHAGVAASSSGAAGAAASPQQTRREMLAVMRSGGGEALSGESLARELSSVAEEHRDAPQETGGGGSGANWDAAVLRDSGRRTADNVGDNPKWAWMPAGSYLRGRLNATETWLRERTPPNDRRHTARLLTVGQERAVFLERFLRHLADFYPLRNLMVYPARLRSGDKFVVTFGVYPSRADARIYIGNLPFYFTGGRPFAQSMAESARESEGLW